MSQAALIHQPGRGGIWKKFRMAGSNAINAAPWLDAIATKQFVGTCKACGGCLRPEKPYRSGLTDWYPATCINCGTSAAAAGPKPAKKRRTHP